MTTQDQIDFIRTQMRNYLVKALESGQIELENAKKLAKFTADHITDDLDTSEKIKTEIDQIGKEFPEQVTKIQSMYTSLKVNEAREKVDNEVIPLTKSGKLDEALDFIKQITV